MRRGALLNVGYRKRIQHLVIFQANNPRIASPPMNAAIFPGSGTGIVADVCSWKLSSNVGLVALAPFRRKPTALSEEIALSERLVEIQPVATTEAPELSLMSNFTLELSVSRLRLTE